MASTQTLDTTAVVVRVQTLLNRYLVSILKAEGLPHSGIKAGMQQRIIGRIQSYALDNNAQGFNRLKNMIFNPDAIQSPTGPKLGSGGRITPVVSSPRPTGSGSGRSIGSASQNLQAPLTPIPGIFPPNSKAMRGSAKRKPGPLTFKESPFFTVIKPLTPLIECPTMTSHRHSATTHLQFTPPDIEILASDKTIRVMVYCAAEGALTSYTKTDIAFPHQVELKVNNDEVKANLRGLKNKAGSTRPADITDLLHRKPKYENTITLTYALTQKKFSFLVNLVKVHQVEELVSKLRMGKSISRDQAIKEMVNKAQDADLVATSTVMSLKCPLSTLRMELPCRSTVCPHIQCFDATSFLQLQEQAPTWTCPICNKIINFEALVVDQYVNDILQSNPKSVDQVTIEPDGKWSQNTLPISPRQIGGSNPQNGDDDDDIIEIQGIRLSSLKSEYTSTPVSGPRTPSTNSREPSTSRSSASKRPVIDLTLSDDDEPPRPAKRTMISSIPNGQARRNGYRTLTSGLPHEHETANSSRWNSFSFSMPSGNSRSNPSSIGTPDR